jgi:hypothetical protein
MKSREEQRLMIQIEHPQGELAFGDAERLLGLTGIELDKSYGPILVNPKKGRYVVRGFASPAAVAKAKALPGVSVFADAPIQPARK